MGVEGSNDLYTTFSSELLLNLELLLVIKDSFNRDWLERPLLFELVKVLSIGPNKVGLVLGCDVDSGFFKILRSTGDFVLLVFLLSVLVFG